MAAALTSQSPAKCDKLHVHVIFITYSGYQIAIAVYTHTDTDADADTDTDTQTQAQTQIHTNAHTHLGNFPAKYDVKICNMKCVCKKSALL